MTDLAELRTDRGMTQAQVATALGVSRALIGFYETGERQVPVDVRARLLALYGVGETSGSSPASPSVLLRSNREHLNPAGRGELNILDGVLELYVDLLDELKFEPCAMLESPFGPVDARAQKAEAEYAARRTRSWMSSEVASFADPLEAVNRVAMVFQLPMGTELDSAPSGFFFKHPQAGLSIAVNSDMTLGRQHFSVAHELAHALFHSQSLSGIVSPAVIPSRVDGRERFANQFAVEFLMPADAVTGAVKSLPRWASRAPAAQRVLLVQREFGVSYSSAAFRLRNLGLISAAELDQVQTHRPTAVARALGWSMSPLDAIPDLPDRLAGFPACMQWLFRAGIDEGVVTVGDVAETAGVSTEAVWRMLQPAEVEPDDVAYERYAVT
jgi:Zn-dependent peptidase ImmA (M78 family)